jgi:hypothetical protein
MPAFRCYFLDANDRIAGSPEIIDADGLNEAIDRALDMLRARPSHHAVELWDGGRRVIPATRRAYALPIR